jgi:uncharacterized protein (TIGR03083 family)
MTDRSDREEIALNHATIAGEAFTDNARLLASVQEADWSHETGCKDWDLRTLEGHLVGEAVWFAHLVLEVGRGEQPLPAETWDRLAALPADEMSERLATAARDLPAHVRMLTPDELESTADLGWRKEPLYRALLVGVMEAVYHNWDARVSVDPDATIPAPWAQHLAENLDDVIPALAHRKALAGSAGVYAFRIGDGVGTRTITVGQQGVAVRREEARSSDVVLTVNADAFVRLVAGRFPLESAIDAGTVQLDGDRERAVTLNALFGGIANG